MKIIMIDDEKLALSELSEILLEHYPDAEVNCFTETAPAIEFLKNNTCDVAFVDINMPDKTGLELAVELKEICGSINIIFVTGYSQYAVDAFSLNASGYILKPAQTENVLTALENLRNPIPEKSSRLFVQCFGNFEVFHDGQILPFKRKKAKELMAVLVDRNGAGMTAKQICAVLFPADTDDAKNAAYLRQLVLDLRNTLKSVQAEDVLRHDTPYYRIDTNLVRCDYLSFLESGKPEFHGEYMTQYSWAEETCAMLQFKK